MGQERRRLRVVVLSRQGSRSLLRDDAATLEARADVSFHALDDAPSPDEAVRLLRHAEVLASTNACLPVLDAALLDRLPQLQVVVLYATGYDHVDTRLLASRGVILSVLPDYATGAVAEHAIALLLALATKLPLAHDRSRGVVSGQTSLRGIELSGRTLGVVGVGRIGTRVARLGCALGMKVIGADVDDRATTRAMAQGIPMTTMDQVLAESQVLAICASQRFGAAPILGASELHRIRPDALLVNVSRAGLVDTAAAAAAIRAGRLGGYGVDDTVVCPHTDGDLLAEGRIVQTGHSAWWRDEVLDRGRRMWADHILAAVERRPLDVVAPDDAPARHHGSAVVQRLA